MPQVDAAQNPALANALINQAVGDTADDIATPELYSGIVELPGGWLDPQGNLHKEAEVRELTGADEEAMGKAMIKGTGIDWNRMFKVIMERGVVKLGDRAPTPKDLESLLYGDRDAILLGIRIATYGNEHPANIICPLCGRSSDVAFELDKDIPYRKLEDPANIWRKVTLRNGRVAEIRLVTVADQAAATADMRVGNAQMTTILLSRCVRSIDGEPHLGEQDMQKMGAGDRKILNTYLMDKAPGPRMGEVVVSCPQCNEESSIAISMTELF